MTSRTNLTLAVILPLALTLGACAHTSGDRNVARLNTTDTIQSGDGPPDAAPGTCWGRDETPAVIETVTEKVLVTPETRDDAGKVLEPATYRTETRQHIVQDRDEVWFETPCESALTPDFVASVQRALSARGYFTAPVTGELDAATRRAIRAFQKPLGLDSAVLSLSAARKLGLVAVEIS